VLTSSPITWTPTGSRSAGGGRASTRTPSGGYASCGWRKVHWQAGDRLLPAPAVSVAGESVQWVDPAEIPSDGDIGKFGQALAAGAHGDRDELMANTAAYSGLRWGELIALTIPQLDQAARVITVDRKVVEVAGHLFVEAPKNRKHHCFPGIRKIN
jgi:integrase